MIPTSRSLFLLPLLALAGCMNTNRAAVHVDIADISIANATVGATEAVFTLHIANQELYPTVVERDIHKIFVNGVHIGDASDTEIYPLPQLGVAKRVIKVQISEGPAMDALRAAVQRGGGEYKIESRLSTNSGGEKGKIVLASGGTFTIGRR